MDLRAIVDLIFAEGNVLSEGDRAVIDQYDQFTSINIDRTDGTPVVYTTGVDKNGDRRRDFFVFESQ